MNFRAWLAICLGKFAGASLQRFQLGSGTSLPGKIALKCCPGLLGVLGTQIQMATVAITGTNGKSTTAGLLAAFLEADGKAVVHNELGANMLAGITTALLRQTTVLGRLKAAYGVVEVDEASLPGVAHALHQTVTVVTNLFRDQLDRYGELDTTARFIQNGIQNSRGKLILNADDPMVTAIGRHFSSDDVEYFGVESVEYPQPVAMDFPVPFPREVTDCPVCQAPLNYSKTLYGHLGHYHCSQCDFARPPLDLCASLIHVDTDASVIEVNGHQYRLPLPGLFNAYNFLAAAAAAQYLQLSPNALTLGLQQYGSLFGRAEHKIIDGKDVMIMLIKNPMGTAEVLKVACANPNGRLLIAINDNDADGRDISWLWDAPFEWLAVQQKPICVSGSRADDMAVRLQYAGLAVDNITVIEDLTQAWQHSLNATKASLETLYILPTYTVLLDLSRMLRSR